VLSEAFPPASAV